MIMLTEGVKKLMSLPSLTQEEELILSLSNFDFYYNFSDDVKVWRRGEERKKVLKELINDTVAKIHKDFYLASLENPEVNKIIGERAKNIRDGRNEGVSSLDKFIFNNYLDVPHLWENDVEAIEHLKGLCHWMKGLNEYTQRHIMTKNTPSIKTMRELGIKGVKECFGLTVPEYLVDDVNQFTNLAPKDIWNVARFSGLSYFLLSDLDAVVRSSVFELSGCINYELRQGYTRSLFLLV